MNAEQRRVEDFLFNLSTTYGSRSKLLKLLRILLNCKVSCNKVVIYFTYLFLRQFHIFSLGSLLFQIFVLNM